ncbi:hypothetical protein [Streptacidiphilus albus]|uniref:hypothetical protein n=1 Tax=Streptacidiphilus albus TaxID=105425 RepID=UPI00054BBA98|nr:hypothetical protein [Streptacidiphilus albus]
MPDAATSRSTAAQGWIYGYALLENYRTMYPQAVDSDDPRYVGGFGAFRHYSQPFTPTPPSWTAPGPCPT